MAKQSDISPRAMRGLKKLGADLAIARKRRRIRQAELAEGAGVHISTIRRLEAGDPGVSLATLSMVMLVLGEPDRLGQLIDMSVDDIGLTISASDLPQRVRKPKRSKGDGGPGEAFESDRVAF